MAKVSVTLKSAPLDVKVWDKAASRAVGQAIVTEIRRQARGSAGVDGSFPRGAQGQRVTLRDTGRMLDTLAPAEVTDTGVTVASDAEYAEFVNVAYPFLGYSRPTEIAALEVARDESGRAFERSNRPESGRIAVTPDGRGRDR